MKSFDLQLHDKGIFVRYSPQNGAVWIQIKVKSDDSFSCMKVFGLQKGDISFDSKVNPTSIEFKIADVVDIENEKYYLLDKRIFGISFNFYIDVSCRVTEKWLIGARSISIPRILEKIGIVEDFFIGGKMPSAISEKEYLQAIKSIPTATELGKYVNARVYREFVNLVGVKRNCETEFQKYLLRKSLESSVLNEEQYRDFDTARYKLLLSKLKSMLDSPSIYETVWEKEILKIIQIIYPQYVVYKNQAKVKDTAGKIRRIDLLLGNSEGNIDILEIKRPSNSHILTKTNSYRENYVPLRELSGTIMQCEKYIYYLQKGGKKAESGLDDQYKKELPNGYHFHIVNPKAIIIMGR